MNLSEKYPVKSEQKVAWGDMDAFGHVNNVIYYRYMESARIDYFSKLDILNSEVGTVVASSQCKYIKPVFYPDHLSIYSGVVEIRNSAFRMKYELYSHQQECIVAEGEAVVVCVDKLEMTKVLIPEYIKNKIICLEKTVNNDLFKN
ncbi:acyl-CoA thioesterase [Acinetobacter sp. 194]|uniref:acyl-CoA thioesterase n=1 Tax=Acinetobacter shaoyimingii TaxID=2715164 RepID=UPI00140DE403|nr:thioesterase family protein [Acinetobacter shaoyimingii]NHB59166.1 acyl-CoA thioesterase [Acinetobacter shaoyimingii]